MRETIAVIQNNMSKLEVKYVPSERGRFISEGRKKINLSSISLLISCLAILLSVVFFTVLISWMVGISQQIEIRDQEVERLEYMLEKRGLPVYQEPKQELGEDLLDVEDQIGDLIEVDPVPFFDEEEQLFPTVSGESSTACLESPAAGPCRGRNVRYYWDSNQGSCLKFSYGGCAGNKNNFVNEEECEASCKSEVAVEERSGLVHQLSTVHQCEQPAEPGPCKGNISRWYFSVEKGCTEFSWGGCGGNSNNFISSQKCQSSCSSAELNREEAQEKDKQANINSECLDEKDPGLCFGAFKRFFFNPASNQCEEFMYGGCGGTRNNFSEKGLCEAKCTVQDNK